METAPVLLDVETTLAACRGDSALARALIEQYRLELPAERAGLAGAHAVAPPDWEAIRQRAHRLRSGSAYLGAERIAAAARDLEVGV
ncbi:MAG: Hpt domain-containing protein, partial [Candidatus Competibacter sp.]